MTTPATAPGRPAQPDRLLAHVRLVSRELRRLSAAELPPGAPVTFDPAALAEELEQVAGALRRALEEIGAGLARANARQAVKDRAKAGFGADGRAGLRPLTALASYAGRPKLAERVRRSRARCD